ncbi:phenyltransferase domain-containing protein [Desulfoluna limicola]|uniref:phenyltransferase domain-containing protein n=1 Tax=Desulfoluna limicola TaxID=2810562 RepID=UPI001F427C07|nr:phenyltransferase domain-containing protein [Desulfoluna limicola]
MEFKRLDKDRVAALDLEPVVASIVRTQLPTGEIPWSDGDKTDPWDHVEAAMGLAVGGRIVEARRAFAWLASMQLENGSWHASYKEGVPEDRTHDTNMSSYVAVGVYHHFLITADRDFLKTYWPTLRKGLDFALSLQAPGGEIHWATSPDGVVDPMALLTGSSSIYMSLKCGLAIAFELGYAMPHWVEGMQRVREAIRTRPHCFNVTKSRFSMDWFYPMLSGALTGREAQNRLDKYWKKFVVEGQGVRCVSDEPWVTVAETAEFILALSAMGNTDQAHIVFDWIKDSRFDDGSYWCGYTFPNMVIWPEEKLSWTNGVVLMAADALFDLTPAGRLFQHDFWESHEALDLTA